jgi:hypothetical protein
MTMLSVTLAATVVTAGRHRGDHELGYRLLHLLRRGLGRLARHGDVELSRLEGSRPRAALNDDHVPEPVEVGPVLDEVVLVLHVLDELAAAPLLDLERPRAHAAGAVVGGVHVGGIDRRVAGGEEHEERRLRPLEPEDHRVGVGRLDGLHVRVPVLARVETELGGGLRRLADHVEGELDVLGGEGLPVVPLDVPAEEHHEVPVIVLPGPPLRELGDHGVGALHGVGGIEHHQVVEARRRREDDGDGRRLVDGESLGEILAQHDVEGAAGLAGRHGGGRGHAGDGLRRLLGRRLAGLGERRRRPESEEDNREGKSGDDAEGATAHARAS